MSLSLASGTTSASDSNCRQYIDSRCSSSAACSFARRRSPGSQSLSSAVRPLSSTLRDGVVRAPRPGSVPRRCPFARSLELLRDIVLPDPLVP